MGITVKKEKDMAEWYQQVCVKAELAEFARIKGCMIVRPRGYAIWQAIQDHFNKRLRELGVQNAYFPMFITKSFFDRESENAQWLAKECAVVTN